MSTNELADCEKVAQQIYDQENRGLIVVPAGYSAEKTDTIITVKKDGYLGSVRATLSNGELQFEHNDGTSKKVTYGIVGVLIAWFALDILIALCLIIPDNE